ncbi:hypothetical protein COCNU_15G002040 [Cocos nucifera]|uniref:CrcB-like protein n=1 Tax=Cocos nucifera TaxID=13894 RepID=A0A8K0IWS9_COCNU|nr:hypothetical protein COCNU_15G002040 [Cocos nucifera]
MHESSRRNRDSDIDAPSSSVSPSIRLSLDSSSQRNFRRSASLGTTGNASSWRRSSISISHGGSRPIVEGVPNDTAALVGASGDRAVGDEIVIRGARQDSLSGMSSRGSLQRGSISLSRDVGDRILDSIRLSHELVDHILGDVDSEMAQVGDRGDKAVADDRVDDARNVENGPTTPPDDALIISIGFQSHDPSLSSPVSPLMEEIISPLATDAILNSTEKNQMQKSTSLKVPFRIRALTIRKLKQGLSKDATSDTSLIPNVVFVDGILPVAEAHKRGNFVSFIIVCVNIFIFVKHPSQCVWIRWYLARLNGQGLGREGRLRWLPIGTLSANILAACIMAALATISKAVNTKRCSIVVSGVQFGFLGCLSTVSTFIAEVYAMWQSGYRGRAYAYTAVTILPSFALGTLIYSVPVWTKHYN